MLEGEFYMKYKAIYFDRDNTLTHANPHKIKWRDKMIESLSGKKFELNYDKMLDLFCKAGYPKGGLKTVDEEIEFWKRYYQCILIEEGIKDKIEERANLIFQELWLKDRILFPEVIEVLEYFKNNGYKIGVISDTSPSLELTLKALGLSEYFDCYICSDLVGVMKPDPKIYQEALDKLGVAAEESIYVDDYDVEADGARNIGFTSFHIDRKNKFKDQWDIYTLKEIVYYVKRNKMGN